MSLISSTSSNSPSLSFGKQFIRTLVTRATLPNGMQIATLKPKSSSNTGAIGVWVKGGSRYETHQKHGSAHFLEHLAFKGTPKRPQNKLEMEVEDAGAYLGAYTSREHTVFMSRFRTDDVDVEQSNSTGILSSLSLPLSRFRRQSKPEWMLSIIGDLIFNSHVSEHAVERERGVILREMAEVDKLPEETLMDQLHSDAFGPNTGLGRSILGTEEAIQTLSRNTILDHKKEFYIPQNMLVVGVGPWSHEDFVSWISKTPFGKAKAAPPSAEPEPEQWHSSGSGSSFDEGKATSMLGFAWKDYGWNDPLLYSSQMLHSIVGQFDHLKDGHGIGPLATIGERYNALESITPFSTTYSDVGLSGVLIKGSDEEPRSLYKSAESIWELWHHLAENKLSNDDLDEAQLRLKCEMVSERDDLGSLCEDVGNQLTQTNVHLGMPQICKKFDYVTPESVQTVAQHNVKHGYVISAL